MYLWKVTVMSMFLAFKKISLKKAILSENTDARECGNFRDQICDILQDSVEGLYRTPSKTAIHQKGSWSADCRADFPCFFYASVHTSKLMKSSKSTREEERRNCGIYAEWGFI